MDSGHYFSICEFQVFGHAITLVLHDASTPSSSVVTGVNSAVSIADIRSYPPNEYLITRETSTSLTYTLGVPTRTSAAEGRICTEDLIGGYVRYCESGRT